jgi:O-antigen/teichoic acid export membrane protein
MRYRIAAIGELLLGKDESASLRQRLIAGVAGLLSLRVMFGAISFAVTVLLARTLGASGVGSYTYALAWVTLLGAPALLGVDQLLVREIPAYQLKGEWGLMKGIVRAANRIVSAASLCLILVALAVSIVLRHSAPSENLRTLWVALVLIPLIALTRVRQSTLQSLHRVVIAAVPERLILPALLLISLEASRFANVALSAPVAMGLNVAATCVTFAAGALLLHRHFPAEAKSASPVYRTRHWVKESAPIFLFGAVSVVFSQADLLILGSMTGPSVVGPYGIADKTADLLTVVLVAQNSAFSSTAASLAASKDYVTLQRLTTRIARLTLLGTLPAAIVFIGFGRWFLAAFYGPEFASAQVALAFLSLGQLVNVAAGLNGLLLVMMGETGEALKVVGISSAVNVVLNFALIPKWGMNGAAFANMTSLILWNVLATTLLERKTGIHTTIVGKLKPGSTAPTIDAGPSS